MERSKKPTLSLRRKPVEKLIELAPTEVPDTEYRPLEEPVALPMSEDIEYLDYITTRKHDRAMARKRPTHTEPTRKEERWK
ncbi:hypothetical protein EON65_56630 [archaeon]|nr:MAG: hypothetical protein EON65_56630 [archaeon]